MPFFKQMENNCTSDQNPSKTFRRKYTRARTKYTKAKLLQLISMKEFMTETNKQTKMIFVCTSTPTIQKHFCNKTVRPTLNNKTNSPHATKRHCPFLPAHSPGRFPSSTLHHLHSGHI